MYQSFCFSEFFNVYKNWTSLGTIRYSTSFFNLYQLISILKLSDFYKLNFVFLFSLLNVFLYINHVLFFFFLFVFVFLFFLFQCFSFVVYFYYLLRYCNVASVLLNVHFMQYFRCHWKLQCLLLLYLYDDVIMLVVMATTIIVSWQSEKCNNYH